METHNNHSRCNFTNYKQLGNTGSSLKCQVTESGLEARRIVALSPYRDYE